MNSEEIAVGISKSEACAHQAFQHGRAMGLQFHLKASMESIDDLIKNCSDELSGGGEYVQSDRKILARVDVIPEMNQLMARFLDEVEGRYGA